MGCGLGWFVGPQLLLCDGLDWVSRMLGWVGLGWVEEIGSTDNSGVSVYPAVTTSETLLFCPCNSVVSACHIRELYETVKPLI